MYRKNYTFYKYQIETITTEVQTSFEQSMSGDFIE